MQFDVYSLFQSIGTVSFVQKGLYYEYNAEITTTAAGIIKLYGHGSSTSCCLGVCVPNGDVLTCCGRISIRSLGQELSCLRFDINPFAWRKYGTEAEQFAIVKDDSYLHVAFLRNGPFPKALLPYFCFFAPCYICGDACMIMDVDAGKQSLLLQSVCDAFGT